ncbi:MAG: isoaspartyl peptidase/L-asparaginase family protein, partial [Myxococcota bacterium]
PHTGATAMSHPSPPRHAWSVGVHGGAGAMRTMGHTREEAYRQGLHSAIQGAGDRLEAGESAINAVTYAVALMERSGAFNAGVGSGLNRNGIIETDAAVMWGADRSIGALAAAPALVNPVEVASAIRTHSPHCLLAGDGVLQFAQAQGLRIDLYDPPPERLERYRQLMSTLDDGLIERTDTLTRLGGTHNDGDTVGAVALDRQGHLAVAVSTGGIWLKQAGRVGDSPLPGSGFWAEDGVGACTATGTGEFIIRAQLCIDAITRMRSGTSVETATQAALDALEALFGRDRAGLIAIDPQGRLAFPFHTRGMGRAAFWSGEPEPHVAVWPEEGLMTAG